MPSAANLVNDPSILGQTTETPKSAPRERITSLDGMRGIAALCVMGYHFIHIYAAWYRFPVSLSFNSTFFENFRYGVQLFFLISGFVIFMTIERSSKPFDFVRSRFSRLYPAYWLSMLIAIAVLLAHIGPPAKFGAFEPRTTWQLLRRSLINLTMIQGWFGVGSINWVYWTLQVEMSFYAIMLFILWRKWIHRTIPLLAGLVAMGMIEAMLYKAWPNRFSPWIRNLLALDYLHIMTLGIVIYKMRLHASLIYIPVIVLCLIAPFFQYRPYQDPIFDSTMIAVLAVLVFLATTGRIPFLAWRPVIFLGSISYSLYLNHELIGDAIIYQMTRRGFSSELSLAVAFAVPLVLATAITYGFERPIARFLSPNRKRFGEERRSGKSAQIPVLPA